VERTTLNRISKSWLLYLYAFCYFAQVFAVILTNEYISLLLHFTLPKKTSRVNNAYFKVKLTETCALPLNALRNALTAKNEQLATSLEHVNRIMQCIDVIYKNHMNKVMVTSGRSPRMFHLPEELHVTEADRRGGRDYMNPVIGNNLRNTFYQVSGAFFCMFCFRLVYRLTNPQLLFCSLVSGKLERRFHPSCWACPCCSLLPRWKRVSDGGY
jgi:hypothetical protein